MFPSLTFFYPGRPPSPWGWRCAFISPEGSTIIDALSRLSIPALAVCCSTPYRFSVTRGTLVELSIEVSGYSFRIVQKNYNNKNGTESSLAPSQIFTCIIPRYFQISWLRLCHDSNSHEIHNPVIWFRDKCRCFLVLNICQIFLL